MAVHGGRHADFIYARLHGDEELYVSGYTDAALDWWAASLRAGSAARNPRPDARHRQARKACRNRDVYVYFDNDVKVRAPFDAMNLAARLAGKDAMPARNVLIKKVGEVPRTRWPGFRRRASSNP
jgi:uncharacterized protein YecE (DUF72 family)